MPSRVVTTEFLPPASKNGICLAFKLKSPGSNIVILSVTATSINTGIEKSKQILKPKKMIIWVFTDMV